ncbi:MAG: hypothetical protein JNK82_36120 [Myxococcaceae bacterium]|nr:hypothetical protein [Myxococcaceae bacterium]
MLHSRIAPLAVLAAATALLAPVSALARAELGSETHVGVSGEVAALDVGARELASLEQHLGNFDEGCELVSENSFYENGHRFYDPELGRYTAPEPILRSPNPQVLYAYLGHSMPAYSYAGNNPLYFTDRNGREFRSNSPAFWESLSRLSRNPTLAPYLDAMQRSTAVFEFTVTDDPFFPGPLGDEARKHGGGFTGTNNTNEQCGGAPNSPIQSIVIPGLVQSTLKSRWGLDKTSLDQAVGHELGHQWEFWTGGPDPSIDWENNLRSPGPFRPAH